MSRVITVTPETYVASQASDAQVVGYSAAAWVYLTSYGIGGTVFVKSPDDKYFTFLEILNDGTLYASCGDRGNYGSIGGANISVAVAGSGYVHNDTGVVVTDGGNEANYVVNSVSGSGIATLGFNGNGSNYKIGNTYSLLAGGSQPGVGSGATITVNSLVNASAASAQSNETVPLNAWTHLVMTWGADDYTHLYINGVECTYLTFGRTNAPDTSTGPLYIGDDHTDFAITGSIAEMAIFGNTKLSSGQAAALAASTTGVPSTQTSVLTDYWHLCGISSPEPNAANPTNFGSLSTPAPAAGGNSPGYSSCIAARATTRAIYPGEYRGTSLATAFFNPHHIDLLQVVNEGGEVVWSLKYDGTAGTNPVSFTPTALLGRFYGASFALAFPNPYSKDILQIIGPGDAVLFWIDSTGAAHS